MSNWSCVGTGIIALAVVQANLSAALTNSWTKGTSGVWEEPYWSLGVLPSMNDGAVEFRNPGWKALGIFPSTTANYPGSLAIQNLTVDAPVDSSNLLLLNYAGLNVPLRVAGDFVLGTNGSLISYYSALNAQTFSMSGPANFSEQSVASFGTITLGTSAPAELNILNATLSAQEIDMLASTALNVTNGVLDTSTLEVLAGGNPGTAQVNCYGGNIRIHNLLRMGKPRFPTAGLVGNFLLSGGRLEVATNKIDTGRFTQTGGTNLTEVLYAPGDTETTQCEYFLLGGFLGTGQLELGIDFGGVGGTFVQSNGVHASSDFIRLWAVDRTGAHNVKGRYTLAGGVLSTPQLLVKGGSFTQNGGSNQTSNLMISEDGSYYIDSGFLTASNVTVSSTDTRGFYSSYYHQGGTTTVPGTFTLGQTASFTIQEGAFSASNIVVGVGETQLQGRSRPIFAMPGSGTIVNSNFTLSGGNIAARSQHQLGKLILGAGNSVLGFDESGAVLRFLDSHTAEWPGSLGVVNWAGSTNGGAGTQLFFGTSAQGLTAGQLSRMYFYNPAGLPTGNYPARILATGEVVPTQAAPSIVFRRSGNQLVLSWPVGFQLYTATNVEGPYTPVQNATSPYTVDFSDPQRFFELRPTPNYP